MKILKMAPVIFGLLTALWLFAVDSSTLIPPNAVVFVNPTTNTFFSPPLVEDDYRTFVLQADLASLVQNGITAATPTDAELTVGWREGGGGIARVWLNIGEMKYSWEPPLSAIIVNQSKLEAAENAGAEPDAEHQQQGGFVYTRTNLSYYLEKVGILRSRWEATGEWNW